MIIACKHLSSNLVNKENVHSKNALNILVFRNKNHLPILAYLKKSLTLFQVKQREEMVTCLFIQFYMNI